MVRIIFESDGDDVSNDFFRRIVEETIGRANIKAGLYTPKSGAGLRDGVADVASHAMSLPVRVAAPEVEDTRPILHKFAPPKSELDVALDAWGDHMRAENCVPDTVTNFRRKIQSAAKHYGWSTYHEITYENVKGWIGKNLTDGVWQAPTADQHLYAFRGFTSWLRKTKRVAEDPLADASGIGQPTGPGPRSATVDEARRLIAYTLRQMECEGHCVGNPALFFYGNFMHGLRNSELGGSETKPTDGSARRPRGWLWGDMRLKDSIPSVRWLPVMAKKGRDVTLPLHPHFVELLLEHRETVPNSPTDLVFPERPARATFEKYAKECGIEKTDYRGRIFSPHSCRSFFDTELAKAGAQQGCIDYLMRHQTVLGKAYNDATLETLQKNLLLLPDVWPTPPKTPPTTPPKTKINRGIHSKDLDSTPPIADTHGCCNDGNSDPTQIDADFGGDAPTDGIHLQQQLESRGRPPNPASVTGPRDGTPVASTPHSVYKNITSSKQEWGGMNRLAVADLLDAVSRLLRSGADDGSCCEHPPPRPKRKRK